MHKTDAHEKRCNLKTVQLLSYSNPKPASLVLKSVLFVNKKKERNR
jgi:hypothetical protein